MANTYRRNREKNFTKDALMVGKVKRLYDVGYDYNDIAHELDIAKHQAAYYVKLIDKYYEAKQNENDNRFED